MMSACLCNMNHWMIDVDISITVVCICRYISIIIVDVLSTLYNTPSPVRLTRCEELWWRRGTQSQDVKLCCIKTEHGLGQSISVSGVMDSGFNPNLSILTTSNTVQTTLNTVQYFIEYSTVAVCFTTQCCIQQYSITTVIIAGHSCNIYSIFYIYIITVIC